MYILLLQLIVKYPYPYPYPHSIIVLSDVISYKPTSDEMSLLKEVEQFTEAVDVIEKEVAHRFKHKYDLGQCTRFVTDPKYSWIYAVSRGGCIYSCDDLIKVIELMNNIFEEYHGLFELRKEAFIFATVTNMTI